MVCTSSNFGFRASALHSAGFITDRIGFRNYFSFSSLQVFRYSVALVSSALEFKLDSSVLCRGSKKLVLVGFHRRLGHFRSSFSIRNGKVFNSCTLGNLAQQMHPNKALKGVRFANWTAKAARGAVHSLRSLLHGATLRFGCPLARS